MLSQEAQVKFYVCSKVTTKDGGKIKQAKHLGIEISLDLQNLTRTDMKNMLLWEDGELSHIYSSATGKSLPSFCTKVNSKGLKTQQGDKGKGLPGAASDPAAFPSSAAEKDPYLGAEEILAVACLLLETH